ncbi:MAG: 2-oxoglutarate dehydrogenase complex dihydrolipoyllysine-residue succinyltransferase [Rhodobacteraceae bacterium]|nr:2-oxoglutarate dehydrogenase complex dihydrolipoyllysine-residue succinyltransferase [Paracoccaceae bacterium]MCY4326707.1 2-oxoglutarate dehydrogenase complex dihydrolipoyllysine-residue succinyltransferase [Paracoccaceae bacterium]
MIVDVEVPTLGESVTEATVGGWSKETGEAVSADEIICELETDKVTLEVRAPSDGMISEIVAPEGSTVGIGAVLARIDSSGDAKTSVSGKKSLPSIPQDSPQPDAPDLHESRSNDSRPRDIENAPAAKRMMEQNKVSPKSVHATGRDGRILKEDVIKTLEATRMAQEAAAPVSAPQGSSETSVLEERVRMTRLRKTIAHRLKEAQNTAAMLTTYNEVDMGQVMALRAAYREDFEKKHGVRLGFMSFFIKSCCSALIEVPEVNAEIDGDDIVFKKFVHMGVAVGTPTGLVVPVLRHAEEMSFAEIEQTLAERAARARDGKLSMADLQGGTFSISNGGVYGSLMSSPILNPPQSGILGLHKIQQRPVVIDGEIVIRPMMYLALSYDHRIVDGKGAVTFLVRVKESIENPQRLLLEV